jgi:transposase
MTPPPESALSLFRTAISAKLRQATEAVLTFNRIEFAQPTHGRWMARLNLRDDQWERIAHRLPGKPGERGRSAADKRVFVEAVLWMARSGAPRRDLPETFGPWNSVHKRFTRRHERGVWPRIVDALAGDADLEGICIDSTVMRVPRHAAGAKKSGGPGDRSPAGA